MTQPEFLMSDKTIVRKTDLPASQDTLPSPKLEKMHEGDKMRFQAHVNVEQMPEGHHLKKATVFSNVPDGGTWEIMCDEGKAVGGRGTAPSPIMYFAAGLGLCLMSHVEMVAAQSGLALTSVRLEQRSTFETTLNLGGIAPERIFGSGREMELNLIVEAEASAETLTTFVHNCRRACMSLQTVAQAVPVVTRLVLNGTANDIT